VVAHTVQVQQWDPDGTIRLLGAVLRGIPNLPGAACSGRHQLFDTVPLEDPVTRAQRLPEAGRLCRNGTRAQPDLADLRKQVDRSQGSRRSAGTFRKITNRTS
jgi:hypothetical protein